MGGEGGVDGVKMGVDEGCCGFCTWWVLGCVHVWAKDRTSLWIRWGTVEGGTTF